MSGGYASKLEKIKLLKKYKILKLIIKFFYPPMPTLNIIETKILREIQTYLFKNEGKVLNFGNGKSNGSGIRLWKTNFLDLSSIIHLDVNIGDNVNVVGDGQNLPFKNNLFDSIICQAVLEHVENPNQMISEIKRVLKPQGFLYIEVPFLQGFHADPNDFQRYTLEGLKVLMKDFEIVKYGVSVGPFCTLVWILRDGISSFFKNKFFFYTIRFIISWILSPLRYFDFLVKNRPMFQRLASENYILVKNIK